MQKTYRYYYGPLGAVLSFTDVRSAIKFLTIAAVYDVVNKDALSQQLRLYYETEIREVVPYSILG